MPKFSIVEVLGWFCTPPWMLLPTISTLPLPLPLVWIVWSLHILLSRGFTYILVGTPIFWTKLLFLVAFSSSKINLWLAVALITSFKLFLKMLAILSLSLNFSSQKNLLHFVLSLSTDPRENLTNCKNFLAYSRTESFPPVRLLTSRAFYWIISSGKYCSLKEFTNSDQVTDVLTLQL